MRETKTQKGITLIALIITIVVLLILAVVTINAIQQDSIIEYASNAADDYTAKANEEQESLNTLLEQIEESLGVGTTTITVEKAQQKGVLSTTETTSVVDDYGNVVKVPAGFKITADAENVTEGIVIEDCTDAVTKGSQFVWIPVGEVIKSDKTKVEIELGRYNFDSSGIPSTYSGSYTENTTSKYGEVVAKNLNDFISSTTRNKGYYLGRYEARTASARSAATNALTPVTLKATDFVYNYVTQAQASNLSQNMYKDAITFTSDLINSYAWDTAIVYIQSFSGDEDYSMQRSFGGSLSSQGTNRDIRCNIHDMSSNCYEYSTESSSNSSYPWSLRGDSYANGGADPYTSARRSGDWVKAKLSIAFRPIIYLGI